MTSIFSSSWVCRLCGREACAECFSKVRELTTYREGATEAEMAMTQLKRESHAHTNPFFLSCTRRNEHQGKDFSPMSRFCKVELAQVIVDMDKLLKDPEEMGEAAATDAAIDPLLQTAEGASLAKSNGVAPGQSVPPGGSSELSAAVSTGGGGGGLSVGSAGMPSVSVNGNNGEIPSNETPTFVDGELTEETFRRVWEKGIPLVVTGLLPKFTITWTPEYFIEKYPTQSCSIVECRTDATKRMTVGDFFKMFGKYEGRNECWKLKDWPPSSDFRTAFPELYEDFNNAVPIPNYCRRDGALNIASHFPLNTVAPDLGMLIDD
jgi:[histone H3]-dimethyl-L-lysine9 demethylase